MKWNKNLVLKRLMSLEREIGRRPTKWDSSTLYALSRKYFGSWNNMMVKSGHEIKELQRPNFPQRRGAVFYYFLGILSTDGHIQYDIIRKWYRILVFTSIKEEVEMLLLIIKRLFNYNAYVRKRISPLSKKPNYQITISSKKLCEFLISAGIPYGAKSYSMRVPNKILFSSRSIFWHYLRGVFDGDGSIIFTKTNWTFKISSGSKKFIVELEKLLERNSIYTSKISRQKENVWELKIYTKKDIRKIYSYIYKNADFFYSRKKIKWENNMFKNGI